MTVVLGPTVNPLGTSNAKGGAWSAAFGGASGRAYMGTDKLTVNLVYSDDSGAHWVNTGITGVTAADRIAIGDAIHTIVATANFGTEVLYSTDGLNFSVSPTPFPYFTPTDVAWSAAQGKFVMVGSSYTYSFYPGSYPVWTSTDGIHWTGHLPSPYLFLSAVAYSPALNLWAMLDSDGHVYTSPDGATWTLRGDFGISGNAIAWCPTNAMFVAVIEDGTTHEKLMKSTDGITWTRITGGPFSGAFDNAITVVEAGHSIFVGGRTNVSRDLLYESDNGGVTWAQQTTYNDGTSSYLWSLFRIGTSTLAAGTTFGFGTVNSILTGIFVDVPIRAPRFFEGYPWRFIFTDIPAADGDTGSRATTWACNLQTNRQIAKTLDQSTVITLDIDPDNIQVNQIDRDGYPVVAQSKRLVYCFRREGGAVPWKIRAAGIVMIVEDQGDPDSVLTHLTCYDPWKYLEARPCVNFLGALPGAMGFQSWGEFGLRGDQVIGGALKASIQSAVGGFAFIDAGTAYGGTTYWGGTIEPTDQVILNIQQGMSVADVWNQVVESGFCDIVLTPIYDPKNRPGYTHELSVYSLAGTDRPSAVFAWDKLNRALSNIDRLHDATPGNFTNVVQYFVGQGGPPAPLQTNGASITDFGYYWAQQFFPDQTIPSGEVVEALARQALYLTRQGKRTLSLTPTPERAPNPMIDYDVADFIPVTATDRLRATITSGFSTYPPAAFRVESMAIAISDDGIENVGLLVSPDWRTSPFTPPVTELLGTAIDGALNAAATSASRARRTARRASYRLKKPLT